MAWPISAAGLRRLAAVAALALGGGPVLAAEVTVLGVALDAADGRQVLGLSLDRPVPWRLASRDAPPRLEIDLTAEPVLGAAAPPDLADAIVPLRRGVSRLVLPLPAPMRVTGAGVHLDQAAGTAHLRVALVPAAPEAPPAIPPPAAGAPLTVILDPGHGGRDRGAVHGGVEEADIVLALARELATLLAETPGLEVRLTRDDDRFVPLPARVARAEAAGGDLLLSLHADAVVTGAERGASVYVRGDAGDRWIAVRPGGTVTGAAAAARPDPFAAASAGLAAALVEAIASAGLDLTPAPEREADFVVLRSTAMPAALVELGYLTDPGDRARLADPRWRLIMARALRDGLRGWLATAPEWR